MRAEPPSAVPATFLRGVIAVILAITIPAYVLGVVHRNINWDEFYFLSFIYDYVNGRLGQGLQTFHVHLFKWLIRLPVNEVEQIIIARAVFLVLLVSTCAGVYRLSRTIASSEGALFAALCCAGYSNILVHGTSFRSDGLAVCLLVLAMTAVEVWPAGLRAVGVAAVASALAFAITLKSAILLPSISLIIAIGGRTKRNAAERVALFSVALAVAFTVFYLSHRVSVASSMSDAEAVPATVTKAFWRGASWPAERYVFVSVLTNPVQWLFIAWCAVLIVHRRSLWPESVKWRIGIALAPLLSLGFYRNTFPYFFVFLMPLVLTTCALTFDELRRLAARQRNWLGFAVVAAPCAIGVTALTTLSDVINDGIAVQREIVEAVHEVFPSPVPYVDRNGMISSYPKVGFFMSTWGMENYLAEGVPVFREIIAKNRPQFLLVNGYALASALENLALPDGPVLLDDDARTLREHFVRWWGPLYVAGQEFHLDSNEVKRWSILAPGTYLLESVTNVVIDGKQIAPGQAIDLQAGTVTLTSDRVQNVVLRTTAARGMPSFRAPRQPIFEGF